jgi:hypothetical protein
VTTTSDVVVVYLYTYDVNCALPGGKPGTPLPENGRFVGKPVGITVVVTVTVMGAGVDGEAAAGAEEADFDGEGAGGAGAGEDADGDGEGLLEGAEDAGGAADEDAPPA